MASESTSSTGSGDTPLVDLTKCVRTPPKPEFVLPLNSLQKRLRSGLGLTIYLLIAFGLGFFPLLGLSLVVLPLMRISVLHWPLRRFIDCGVAYWMSIITVSFIFIPEMLGSMLMLYVLLSFKKEYLVWIY